MTETAAAAVLASAGAQQVTLGSFALGARQTPLEARLNGVALFAASAMPDTPYAGLDGFAYCLPVPDGNPAQSEQVSRKLAALQALDFDALVRVFETGVSEQVAYVIEEAPPQAERLLSWMERNRRPTPWIVSSLIGDIAAGLQVAHDAGLSHGMVVPAVAWVDAEGKTKLGGFGFSARGPEHDQQQIAALTVEVLAGKPIDAGLLRDQALSIVIDRIRGHVDGLTERVATVIARGLDPHPDRRFGSVAEYAVALRSEIVAAAGDIVAGAWEAISRRDSGMAAILIEKAAEYDPACAELPLLRVRMNQGVMAHPDLATAMFVETKSLERDEPPVDAFAATLAPIVVPGTAEHEAAVRALLTPPTLNLVQPKGNPWFVLIIGVCLMILLLTVLVAITFTKL